jgi:xanthine dehydrogenase accessory factor
MAFADAVFDGRASLDGLDSVRAPDAARVQELLDARKVIPVYVRDIESLLAAIQPAVLVDARMRKHSAAEFQLGLAPLTIGLGPDLIARRHADVVVETSWEDLGAVITAGEPREIGGHSRDRYVYAPCDGLFRTKARIGDAVQKDQEVAEIGSVVLRAPLDGVLRGLTRDGVPVSTRTKVIEVDPRGRDAEITGIAERPRRIAHGVLAAIGTRLERH